MFKRIDAFLNNLNALGVVLFILFAALVFMACIDLVIWISK